MNRATVMMAAASELEHLRKENQILRAKMSVFDDMMAAIKIGTTYRDGKGLSSDLPSTGMNYDIVGELRELANAEMVADKLTSDMGQLKSAAMSERLSSIVKNSP